MHNKRNKDTCTVSATSSTFPLWTWTACAGRVRVFKGLAYLHMLCIFASVVATITLRIFRRSYTVMITTEEAIHCLEASLFWKYPCVGTSLCWKHPGVGSILVLEVQKVSHSHAIEHTLSLLFTQPQWRTLLNTPALQYWVTSWVTSKYPYAPAPLAK